MINEEIAINKNEPYNISETEKKLNNNDTNVFLLISYFVINQDKK